MRELEKQIWKKSDKKQKKVAKINVKMPHGNTNHNRESELLFKHRFLTLKLKQKNHTAKPITSLHFLFRRNQNNSNLISKIIKMCEQFFKKTAPQYNSNSDLFRLCPPLPVHFAPPVTDHVSLHSKSLYKNMARASGGCK